MNANAAVFVPGGYVHSAQCFPVESVQCERLPKVAETEEALRALLSYLEKQEIISVDCEGADLSKGSWRHGQPQSSSVPFHGRLCLLQIATMRGEAFAVDILKLGHRAFELGLKALLESEHPVKVVHDFRQDTDALLHQFGVQPRGLFDCQLCDIFIRRLSKHRTTFVRGSAALLNHYNVLLNGSAVSQEQKQAIHSRFSQDRHLWERRPLSPDMLNYALEDVRPMLQLHQKLLSELIPKVGSDEDAWQLIIEGSTAYAYDFAQLRDCRCRLCCNAAENARFDGHKLLMKLQTLPPQRLKQRLVHMLRRQEEDSQPLTAPGPSHYYVNEMDESVPKLAVPEVLCAQ